MGPAVTPIHPPPPEFTPPLPRDPLREAIRALTRRPEPELLPGLLQAATLDPAQAEAAQALALKLARALRERKLAFSRAGLVQGLLQEFALSSQEGVALMCLAEALLRVPDAATRDALIRDKIAQGQWHAHLGRSPSLFVNAATWGLLLTDRGVYYYSRSSRRDGWENRVELTKKFTETLSTAIRHELRRGSPDGRAQDYDRLKLLLGLDF